MQNKFLSRAEAAQYLTEQRGLKTARTTLQKWVTTGGGPVYRRFGKYAVYAIPDLDAWADSKLSTHSSFSKRTKDTA